MKVRVRVKNQADVNLPFRKQYKARLSFLETKYNWKTTNLACEASITMLITTSFPGGYLSLVSMTKEVS